MKQFKNSSTSAKDTQPILEAGTLEDAVYQLDNQLQNTLEEVAPLITKRRSKHKRTLYDKQLNDQRKIFKNRERKWFKYKMQDLWLPYNKQ